MTTFATMFSFYTSLAKSLFSLAFARLYKAQVVPPRDLTGQTAIVTGANSGIGLSIAVALATQGADVYLACRNAVRGAAAVDHVIAQCHNKSQARVSCRILDVGDAATVRAFCEQWPKGVKIDMLVHNAGIAAPPTGASTKTMERLNLLYTTNFLGSFLITHLLEPHLSPTARVVMTSSTGSYSAASHFLRGDTFGRIPGPSKPGIVARTITKSKAMLGIDAEGSAGAYGVSKAQQVLFANLLQRHFDTQSQASNGDGARRTAHAFTPGFTSTPIFGKLNVTWRTWISDPLFAMLKLTEKWVAVDTDEGAKTGIWLATWGDVLGTTKRGGAFWDRMQMRTSIVDLMDEKRTIREWELWGKDAEIMWPI
ncbi:hypothetical protein C7974DRAFT_433970 [Boeremia exigua]|uniref:uncharacterized protein n=1 Tax=Boeremia exigua TaxID=749465 RepID=UPI001E8C9D66|nr:uncharacterized protein C7974DRAFT_433970 [Boeremia exigua]KAH6629382.1 hypothetical protein C7974DRAFT_433970 [Boeremia exigua]